MFRFKLRTLLILLAVVPPLIGYWPWIQKRAVARAAAISAADVVVVASISSVLYLRVRLDRC